MTARASGPLDVQGLFAILAQECDALAKIGEHMQALIGDLAEGGVSRERLIHEAQDSDRLVQHLAELSSFFGALARQTGTDGIDPAAALAGISLADLAARLGAEASAPPPRAPVLPTLGEYELF